MEDKQSNDRQLEPEQAAAKAALFAECDKFAAAGVTLVESRRLFVPFCGSGSEMIGAMQAGWDEIVGVEQDGRYCEIARRRIEYWRNSPLGVTEAN